MNRQIFKYFLLFLFSYPGICLTFGQTNDTIKRVPADSSSRSKYKLKDIRFPYQPDQPLGINLKQPANYAKVVEYDPITNEYVVREKIGKLDYQPPYTLNSQEYKQDELKNSEKNYWTERRKNDKGQTSSSFIPKINFGGEAFDKLFGSNTINIVPQGSAELIFGINTSFINNPALSERLRKTTTFDFQEKIQMNVTGSIGDKMKLGINYNTEATFDFENKTKLEYTGKEDEIIKKIEAGNVSLPLTGSLITGSQSLFGIKTELQFGKLTVTTVVSQQKGESSTIDVKGGAQVTQFEVPIDQYEANKHYFLSQFFRNNYERSLQKLPVITSGVTITKIEVWVTNKSSQFQDARNVVAFMDLGEARPYNNYPQFGFSGSDTIADNSVNGLYSIRNQVRNIDQVSALLSAYSYGSRPVVYEKIENARKLTDREFTLQPNLGYISLNASLNSNEVLAVAYEYTYNGHTYHVGEFSSSNTNPKEALVVKLIKNTNFTPRLPNWDLMMKNVYSINAYQVNPSDFKLNILYKDDQKGTALNYIPQTKDQQILLRVMQLDRLNTNGDPNRDGVFDYIEGVTVNSSNGRIYFPVLEPFGRTLDAYLKGNPNNMSDQTRQKYVFSELYDSTQTKARQIAEKNKFVLQGTYQSAGGADIPLNALNVPQGSVVVTAGGRQLTENVDYTVDYTLGRVKIINAGLLESGTPIRISLENNSLFNFQTKTLLGTHLDYKFSDNFNLGATALHLSERPLTTKVNIGDEPVSNTIWGLNGTYTTKSQLLTNVLDKIPFLNVKEPSSITIDGEFAHLIPGHSKAIDKSGTAYIDDFEGSETPIDLKSFQAWSIASTPADLTLFPEAAPSNINNLSVSHNRAKLAWYVIDPLFQRNTSATPSNIKGNDDIQKNPFVMEVYEKDIFKNYDEVSNLASNIAVLNLAYYPKERGPYNYDLQNLDANGLFTNPKQRWGGMMREITQSDFEASNIEFIEFWLMDPYVLKNNLQNSGSLYFNLGDVSEDVNRDSRKQFENGLPTSPVKEKIDSTVWGYVPTSQSLVNAFSPTGRSYQDVGLDGLSDAEEATFFEKNFLGPLRSANPTAFERIKNDPSSDDFRYFRDSYYDQNKTDILGRYKNYNGMENNSPENTSATGESFSNSTLPNTEDINRDNTLNETESFYQYKVDIDKNKLKVGTNYIVDAVEYPVEYKNQNVNVTWYQFRIPVAAYEKIIGGKADFKSIQFMRMFLTGFNDSVILRFARLNLVRSEWRKYNMSFRQGGESISTPEEGDASFDISAVNIEENSAKKPINYVLPPGVSRQTDPQNPQLRMLNEQSMVLKVNDLSNGDARAAYKNIDFDVRQYKRLKMDVHAEQITGKYLEDNELTLFIRIGSDYKSNYYEYEVPLKVTRPRADYFRNDDDYDRLLVWPDENKIDIALSDLQEVKQARNNAVAQNPYMNNSMVFPFELPGKKGKYYVCGNPNLSNIRTLMIGIRYPHDAQKTGQIRSAEVWVNELRVTDFNEQGGWAANLRVTSRLSDFGSVSVAGNTSTHGFGGVESKINTRSKEDVFQYDLASNLELGKFFPQKSGIQVPMYFGYSESFITPQYNPLDPDIELKTALMNMTSKEQRDFKRLVQDYSERKSLNFTNVRINKTEGKPHLYDISNWTLNYSYNETFAHSTNVERDLEKHYQGGIMYAYQPRGKNIAPFQNWRLFRGNAFRLIRDFNFNLMPTNLGFSTEMSRSYNETQLRDLNNLQNKYDPMVNKDFLWNRMYEIGFDLTRTLKIDFSAANRARIDEPYGVVNKIRDDYQHWKDSVWNNIANGGRTTHYQQDLRINYTLPINKLPLLGWTNTSLNYTGTYDWDAASLSNPDFGNNINNTNTLQLNNQFNLTTLYNKIPYFRRLSQPPLPKAQRPKKFKKVTFERERTFLTAGEPKSIMHNLGTKDVMVKVLNTAGKEIKGKVEIVSDNKITFTADSAYKDVKVTVEGKVEQKQNPIIVIVDNVTRLILGIKNVSISWSTTEGTTLPGFMPKTYMLGMSGPASLYAPGAGFVFGWQDKNIGQTAIRNNWLTSNPQFNNPMMFTYNERLNIRSSVEPFPGFRIDVSGLRTFVRNDNSFFSPSKGIFTNQQISGNYSISFIAWGNAFEKLKKSDNYSSEVFKTFQRYRNIISNRLGKERQKIAGINNYDPNIFNETGGTNGYGLTTQDVLIPAFYAAYGGLNPEKVTLSKFPSIWNIKPNWRLNYDGLTKIDFIKKYARSVSLTHSYTATYNIGNYLSNDTTLEGQLSLARDMQNNFIPRFDISSVSITEQFSPLVGVDLTFINSLSAKVEIRKSRNILLSLSNNQLTETNINEVVVGAGYKINDFNLIVKSSTGNQNAFKSDLNLRADVSVRDNKTIIRRLTNDGDQPAQGQKVVNIKVSADYLISDRFSLRLFYDRIVNTPLIGTSFPTATTNMGFSLRFSLAQ